MKTRAPARKTVPLRFDAAKHRALKSMLQETGTSLQRFFDEVTSAALAQSEAKKRFLSYRREAQSPEKAVAFLRSIQKRVAKAKAREAVAH